MRRMAGPAGAGRAWAVPAASALLILGCAASTLPRAAGSPTSGDRPRVALLPLENLSGRPEAGDLLTRIVFVALGRTGTCEPLEPGDVDAVMTELRIRTSGMLARDQAIQVASKLGARYLMLGTILECGPVRTLDGDVPSVGLALRLLSGDSARVVWSGMRVRTGEDRETVFGWGREKSLERLAEQTATELLREFHLPAGAGAPPREGGKP